MSLEYEQKPASSENEMMVQMEDEMMQMKKALDEKSKMNDLLLR